MNQGHESRVYCFPSYALGPSLGLDLGQGCNPGISWDFSLSAALVCKTLSMYLATPKYRTGTQRNKILFPSVQAALNFSTS